MKTTEEKIAVMQAYADGEEIETLTPTGWEVVLHNATCWNWAKYDYRIKESKPETLQSRIEAQYPEYEVLHLDWAMDMEIQKQVLQFTKNEFIGLEHYQAQSMKCFVGYVYEFHNGTLYNAKEPTDRFSKEDLDNEELIHPVAVLFRREP